MPISAAQVQTTVLCLDDDRAVLELLEEFLPRQGPFEVRSTTDPDRGYTLVSEGDADLVVCDYKMSTCSGVDFLKRLRHNGYDLPFVLFTGHGTTEISNEADSAGATALIRKGGPDRLDALASLLAAAADGDQNAAN